MPSFDVVSEVDMHELSNAIEQSNRELVNRFDFKGVDASFKLEDEQVVIGAPSDFQVQQLQDIFENKCIKRSVDVSSFEWSEMDVTLARAKMRGKVKQGLEKEVAKKITKSLKESKIKVQSSIQGDKLRVTGKKRDDLQTAIAHLKEEEFGQPLQFNNFRD
jgi:uncharacterized protein YajQ (UPF0234 family)